MSETETTELREALEELIDQPLAYDESFGNMLRNAAYQTTPANPRCISEYNAARVVARFLGWDDVPEGEIE